MRKLLALTLSLLMALACNGALADAIDPTAAAGAADALAPTVTTPMTGGALTVDGANGDEPVLFEISGNGADYDVANYTFADGKWTLTAEYTGLTGDQTVVATNNGGQNTDKTPLNGETMNWLVITYINGAGEKVQQGYQYYVDWFQYINGLTAQEVASFSRLTLPCWYPDNTANVFGPKVNGSWQTYAAVDLSADGTQSFDLIGAGAWKIGTVTVTVDGDSVVVDYYMTEDVNTCDVWDDINIDTEYVNLFADADAIDMRAESAFAFGEPISISADLGGDTTVALYVCNVVDYPSHSPYVVRFWPNAPENAAIAESMAKLMAE